MFSGLFTHSESHLLRGNGGTTKRRRRRAVRGSAIGLVATLSLMVFSNMFTSAAGAASSRTLVLAYAGLPTTWVIDASAPAGYENLEYGVNTQAGLIRQVYQMDPSCGCMVQNLYKYQGVLASSWTVSPDQLTYTFHLKHGVKSAAGNPLTADDVLWSWQRKFGAATSITPYIQAPVVNSASQVKVIDPYTVSFTVAKPGYGFTLLSLLANITGYVYDSTLLKEHVTASDPYAVNWSSQNPNIGFGAYSRTSYTPGTEMVLSANPNYVFGEPYYHTLDFRVQADPGTRAEAIKAGSADVAVQLRPADQVSLSRASGLKVYKFPETNMMTMLTMDTLAAPFNNVKVREALADAVPYSQIIKNVYYGRASLTKGLLDPMAPNFVGTGLSYPSYDPTKAKRLLAAAGYPSGISFTLTVSNAVPDVQEAAIQVQSYAAAAGFHITISQQPAAAVSAGISTRKFLAFMWRDMAISSSPQYELGLYFKTSNGGAVGANFSGWVNPNYLGLVDQGTSLSDPTSPAASKLWNEAQVIAQTDTPQIYVGRIQPLNAFRSNITDYSNRLDNNIDYSILKATK